jgi:hypothetical protein
MGCILFASSLHVSLAADPPKNPIVFGSPDLDAVTLIGLSKAEALKRLGEPETISGPEEGYQTYEYPTRYQLSVVFHGGKLNQYVVRPNSKAKTARGIQVGSHLGAVTKEYGDFAREEEVREWFAGSEARVLYHHAEFKKFKLNCPQADLIFMFDGERAVEWIWVGFSTK